MHYRIVFYTLTDAIKWIFKKQNYSHSKIQIPKFINKKMSKIKFKGKGR